MTLTTGQKLWLAPARGFGEPLEVEVGKVGRKWAYLIPERKGRVDIETLSLDGGGYGWAGKCYGSREEWEETTALYGAWNTFRRYLPSSPPPGMTMADLDRVHELLRMPVYSPESSK